jgi:tetratricopeptide (TPR) repeat protein
VRRSPEVALALALIVGFFAGCKESGDPDLALKRARNAVLHERSDWARQYFAEDYRRHPKRIESLRDGAYAWLSGYQRSRAEARTLLATYLELRPDDQKALKAYISGLLVNRDLEEGRRRAEALDDSVDSNILRARLWLDDDPALAGEFISRAIEQGPDDGRVWALGATISERLGDHDKALERGLRAMELHPFDYQNVYLLGRLWRRAGETEKADWALEMHQKLAELAADGTRPKLRPRDELDLLTELATDIPTTNFEYRKRLVTAHFAAGDLATAESLARDLIHNEEVSVHELIALATVVEDKGRRSFFLELLRRVDELDPGNTSAAIAFAVAAVEEARFGDARRIIEAGRARDPWVAYYDFLDGWIARSEGDLETATESLELALHIAPWEASWRIDLADAYLSAGDLDRFRQVVHAAPEQPPEWVAFCDRHRAILGS